jgi:hypothetical protein
MTEFKQEASRSDDTSNNQDIQALYLVKASGSGKTKIGFSLGLEDGFTVVTIRLATNDTSPTVSILQRKTFNLSGFNIN